MRTYVCIVWFFIRYKHTRTHSCDQIDSIITSVTFCRPFLPHSFRMRFVAIVLLDRFDAVVAVAHARTTADVDAASIWFLRYFASFYVFLVHRIGILPLFGRFGFGHFILNLYVHIYCVCVSVCIGCCWLSTRCFIECAHFFRRRRYRRRRRRRQK